MAPWKIAVAIATCVLGFIADLLLLPFELLGFLKSPDPKKELPEKQEESGD